MIPAASAQSPVLDDKEDHLRAWLLHEARLHIRSVARTVELLNSEDIFCVSDLLAFTRLARFDTCGITAMTATKILAGVSRRPTSTATSPPTPTLNSRASRLTHSSWAKSSSSPKTQPAAVAHSRVKTSWTEPPSTSRNTITWSKRSVHAVSNDDLLASPSSTSSLESPSYLASPSDVVTFRAVEATANSVSKICALLGALEPGTRWRIGVLTHLGSYCPITLGQVQAFVEARQMLLDLPIPDLRPGAPETKHDRPTRLEHFDAVIGFVTLRSEDFASRELLRSGDAGLGASQRLELVKLALKVRL